MDDALGEISARFRDRLAGLTARGQQIVTVDDKVEQFGLDREAVAKLMARWAGQGWLRRVRRGLYVAGPVVVERPEVERPAPS